MARPTWSLVGLMRNDGTPQPAQCRARNVHARLSWKFHRLATRKATVEKTMVPAHVEVGERQVGKCCLVGPILLQRIVTRVDEDARQPDHPERNSNRQLWA